VLERTNTDRTGSLPYTHARQLLVDLDHKRICGGAAALLLFSWLEQCFAGSTEPIPVQYGTASHWQIDGTFSRKEFSADFRCFGYRYRTHSEFKEAQAARRVFFEPFEGRQVMYVMVPDAKGPLAAMIRNSPFIDQRLAPKPQALSGPSHKDDTRRVIERELSLMRVLSPSS
jgi:hypothetical protein